MAGGGSKPGNIWVAWTSGERGEGTKNKTGGDLLDGTQTFPRPHIELAVLDPNSLDLLAQPAIWNPDYAFAYPYLAGGPSGEVALTYMAGNGTQYPGWGVGLLTGNRSLARVATGTIGAGRMGDYLAVRPAWPSKKLWAATGNVRVAGGSTYDLYYAVFGRKGDAPPRKVVINRPPPRLVPDLVISDLTRTSFTVTNQGTAPAGGFSVRLTGSPLVSDAFYPFAGLAAGASASQAFNCLDLARTATADARGEVAESNEGNNVRSIPAGGCG
jgi:hypothetical protein